MKKIPLFLLFIISSQYLAAQNKKNVHEEQVWLGYFNQTRFSNKWGMWLDLQLRTREDLFTNFSQGVARIGLTYYLHDDVRLTAGYIFFEHFPSDNHKKISQPEHRPWQQLQWTNQYKKISTTQRVRLEQRYRRKIANDSTLAPGYNFNFRARYSFLLLVPLGKKDAEPKSFSFVVNDEVMVNFGKEIVYNYFDQNRIFIGFNYHLSKQAFLQFGYMNLFQQLSAGNQFRSLHTARIIYFHNMDLR